MRALPENEQSLILSQFMKSFETSEWITFFIMDAEVITGDAEGRYGYIAVNYLDGAVGSDLTVRNNLGAPNGGMKSVINLPIPNPKPSPKPNCVCRPDSGD